MGMMRDSVRPKVTFCLTRWPAKAISRLIADRGALSPPSAAWLISPFAGFLRNRMALRWSSKMGARRTEANPQKIHADTAAQTPVGVTPVTFLGIGLAKNVTGRPPVPKRSSLLGYTTDLHAQAAIRLDPLLRLRQAQPRGRVGLLLMRRSLAWAVGIRPPAGARGRPAGHGPAGHRGLRHRLRGLPAPGPAGRPAGARAIRHPGSQRRCAPRAGCGGRGALGRGTVVDGLHRHL